MRIRFLEKTPAVLSALPKRCYGQLNLEHTEQGLVHYFAKDRESEMPDEIAQGYLDAGVAEPVTDKDIIWGDAPEIESPDVPSLENLE